MKKAFLLMALVSTALFTLPACKTEHTECTTCKLAPVSASFDLALPNTSNKVKINQWIDTVNEPKYITSSGTVQMYDQLTNFITGAVPHTIAGNTTALGIALFTEQSITKTNNILNPSSIDGYSYYYEQDQRLRHTFYLKQPNGEFKVIPEINCEAPMVSYNDLYDINKIFFRDKKMTMILIVQLHGEKINFKNKANSLDNNIQYLKRKMGITEAGAKGTQISQPVECKLPCSDPKPWDHACEQPLNGAGISTCKDKKIGDEFGGAQALTAVNNGLLTQDQADQTYNITLQYALRDSFLNNYTLGRKYIDYYYQVTPQMYLTNDILTATFPLLNVINQKAIKLMAYTSFSNEVFIDNTFKNQLLALLAKYKTAAPNNAEKAVFTDIMNDANIYAGMTYGQFVAGLQ